MQILQRLLAPRRLPPTKDGYQAPSDALAAGWQCGNSECGETGYFAAPRPGIPRRCEVCGSGTYPRHAWPWQHGERRAELDALLYRAEREDDAHLALLVRCHLLTWTFEDHLMSGYRRDALVALDDADAKLRVATRESPHFTEGPYRSALVVGALRSGGPDIALRVLDPWVALAREQGPGYGRHLKSDNASRTNHRSLVSACLGWLADEQTGGHPRYDTVVGWTSDTARAPHVRDWLTADQDEALTLLDRRSRFRR
ncbi:hypothetical protein JS756_30915 [Streptomyces actuosus]|uniref:HEAT repeat domain-containing protein n=1 Tax=Streptomyces actuosus TaxID=1885 RepID=A0ABS2VZ56_STRAS|nr:hypothetical protein [Streptomyces actuosus]MBN0048437.1 hypothetical protein [Streptomyces actuosus]